MGVELAKAGKQVLAANIITNNGHGRARLVREQSPDGEIVEHQVVATGRVIDALREARQIDGLQHQAGTILRDLYEIASVSVGEMPGRDPSSSLGSGGERPLVGSDEAWRKYIAASRQCGQWWALLRLVVIDDGSPTIYGARYRCDGHAMLRAALDRLVRHFGLDARPRKTV